MVRARIAPRYVDSIRRLGGKIVAGAPEEEAPDDEARRVGPAPRRQAAAGSGSAALASTGSVRAQTGNSTRPATNSRAAKARPQAA